MGPPRPYLTIHAEHGREAYVIGLEGELDRSGCADLAFALSQAERTRARRIILDLDGLTYIDSSGLEALLQASRRSASDGNRLKLTRGTGHPADMIRLASLDLTLPFTESIRGTTAGSRSGWNAPSLGPQAPPPGDADLPRLGQPFADRDTG